MVNTYEQFFLGAPLQLSTQILWHLVQMPLAALTSQDRTTSQALQTSQVLSQWSLPLVHTQADYRGNAAACLPRPRTKQHMLNVFLTLLVFTMSKSASGIYSHKSSSSSNFFLFFATKKRSVWTRVEICCRPNDYNNRSFKK